MTKPYTPQLTWPKLEIHVDYRCDLMCTSCSRGSFLRKPHTPPITLAQIKDAFRQADELKWTPRVIIIGGEPTLHPEFYDICKTARNWSRGHKPDDFVQVFSNGHSEKARALLDKVRLELDCSIFKDEWKTASRVGGEEGQSQWHLDMFVSPEDAGLPFQGHCYQHASEICGVGFDSYGFSLCPTGLSVGALLGESGGVYRTKRLADIFDPVWAERATKEMCKHCGYAMNQRGTHDSRQAFADYLDKQPTGQAKSPMSPTWQKAFAGRR